MDSTSTFAQAKSAVFGPSPALGTDGQPLERGVGSRWHRADHIAKANFHAANAWSLCDGLVSQAKALLATAETIAAASKASIEAAQAAKAEQTIVASAQSPDYPVPILPPPTEPPPPAVNHTLDFAAVPAKE